MNDATENVYANHDPSVTNNTLSPTSNLTGNSSANVGSGSSSNQQNAGQVADLNQFVNYIKQFVPVLLDTSPISNLDFEKSLEDKSNVECLRKFLADPQIKNLIFHKFFTKGK
jgi:hypothetical protein